MSEKNTSDVVLAFLVGGLVGAVLGVLYAPSSGKETRQKLKDWGEDMTDKVNGLGDDLKSKTKDILAESREKILSQKERIEEALEAGKNAFQKRQQPPV